MESFTAEIGPRGQNTPPVQIHIHKCDECDKASIQTSKGELEIGKEELEQIECDCQVAKPGQRNTKSIPPKTRREILAKYRHKCQRPGCNHTGYLQIHHKTPRSEGGSNDPKNLPCLCSSCHTLMHAGLWVKSPIPAYEWQSGATSLRICPPVGHTAANQTHRTRCQAYIFTYSANQAF